MSRSAAEPPTLCPLPPVLRSDRAERAEAFVQAHIAIPVPADALHAVAVFTIDYFERAGLSAWSDFPVEAFAGVQLPGELYGFDSLRAAATHVLPLFFNWLGRTGDISVVEAAALAVRARDVHHSAGRTHARQRKPRHHGLPRGVAD